MAGMEYRGDRDGDTYEPGPGNEKAIWDIYTSIAKGFSTIPG